MSHHTAIIDPVSATAPQMTEDKTQEVQNESHSSPELLRHQNYRQTKEILGDRVKLGIEDWFEEEIVWFPSSEPIQTISIWSVLFMWEVQVHASGDGKTIEPETSLATAISMESPTDVVRSASRSSAAQDSFKGNCTSERTSDHTVSASQTPRIITRSPPNSLGVHSTYIYLCINVKPGTTRVFEVDATAMDENKFISTIIRIYYNTMTWQSLLTMTQLHHFEFHRFTFLDQEGHVSIQESCLPPATAQDWSTSNTSDLLFSEAIVSRYFKDHSKSQLLALIPYIGLWLSDRLRPTCQDEFLSRIPKRRPALMMADRHTEYYGILAIPQRTDYGTMATILVYGISVAAFCVAWRVLGGPESMPRASILFCVFVWIIILYGQILERAERRKLRGCWKCFDPYAPRD